MNLLVRINAVLVLGFTLAGLAMGMLCSALLRADARREVLGTASLMLDSALASRAYTANEIDPLLAAQMQSRFLPQSIPYYAATQNFLALRERHPDFYYKEATLNPSNPRDRATDWEADIIEQFRNSPATTQIEDARDTPLGRALYIARPIRARAECLSCHGLASAAPATLIARYGRDNGFGWQPNEVIGAQIVSAPLAQASANATRVFREIMIGAAAVLLTLLTGVNLTLYGMVVRPLRRMTRHADAVSLGQAPGERFAMGGTLELAALAASFERMRKSLEKALKMVGG
ncbi:MAG: c-type heme family protein [Steroidobacteraceae bacterium]